ncbi:hypothetical protein BdWA1_001661 [Babesia duncani]|uniref:Uncharacterized protein n=1 Tax=Babesia duncani TaxID=323732 RepID=A0AAD9PK98_9APIC|nr:hypothetical protein BdWA1_001661 [Babesia duncani]
MSFIKASIRIGPLWMMSQLVMILKEMMYRHFQKLELGLFKCIFNHQLDENIPYPNNITVSLKELLSLSSFCDSIKKPLSLILRSAGDPVIALFGEAASIAEAETGCLNIHKTVATASSQYDKQSADGNLIVNHPNAWSGSLWLSSIQVLETQQEQKNEEALYYKNQHLQEVEEDEGEIVPNHQKGLVPKLVKKPQIDGLSNNDLDLIYRTLCLDFMGQEATFDNWTKYEASQAGPVKGLDSSELSTDVNSRNGSDECSALVDIW